MDAARLQAAAIAPDHPELHMVKGAAPPKRWCATAIPPHPPVYAPTPSCMCTLPGQHSGLGVTCLLAHLWTLSRLSMSRIHGTTGPGLCIVHVAYTPAHGPLLDKTDSSARDLASYLIHDRHAAAGDAKMPSSRQVLPPGLLCHARLCIVSKLHSMHRANRDNSSDGALLVSNPYNEPYSVSGSLALCCLYHCGTQVPRACQLLFGFKSCQRSVTGSCNAVCSMSSRS